MFDSATYQRRRQALRNKVQNGIILILGNNEAPANYPDNTYKFRQDSSFLYFFGHSHPGYAGVIDIEAGEHYLDGAPTQCERVGCTSRYSEKFSLPPAKRGGRKSYRTR